MNALSRPMRVIFVDLSGNAGGSTRSLRALIDVLDPSLVEPVLLFGDSGNRARWSHRTVIETTIAGFHNYSFFPYRLRIPWLLSAARFFARLPLDIYRCFVIFRRFHPDIVHINGGQIIAAGIAGRLAKIPVVWHIRELVEPNVFGRLQSLVYDACSQKVLCVSKAAASRLPSLRERALVVGGPFHAHLVDPVQVEDFRNRWSLGKDDFVVLLLSRWLDPAKGYCFLADVADVMKENLNIRFLLAGEPRRIRRWRAHDREAKRIHERWRTHVVSGRACFVGFVDPDIAIAASSLIVCPNTLPEPFGRTVVEANAQGKPVIATRIGAFDETVEDGVTGWLLPLSVGEWRNQMSLLATHPALLTSTGTAAFLRSKRYASQIAKETVELAYARVLSHRGGHFDEG